MPPPHLRPPPLHPYRLFHLSARLRLPNPPSQPPPQEEDYYTLLLSHPIQTPALKTITPTTSSSSATSPASTPSSIQASNAAIQASAKGPNNSILFSTPLAGPSARMRGLARGEMGLARPSEPDNCCMSGCVNCVWDAYREEVEEWARGRRRRGGDGGMRGEGGGAGGGMSGDEGGVGDLDGVGGMGLVGEDEDGGRLFEGVPVGIREFMNTEKRLRERRAKEQGG